MTSKQEKLAAARRKLKEFQGKNKEGEIFKHKSTDDALKITKDYFQVSDSAPQNNENSENFKNNNLNNQPHLVTQPININTVEENINGKQGNYQLDCYNPNEILMNENSDEIQGKKKLDYSNGLMSESFDTLTSSGKNNYNIKSVTDKVSRDNNPGTLQRNPGNKENIFSFKDAIKVKFMDGKETFDNEVSNKHCLNNVIKPLQMELQNHAQTITILVQQRNDAQTALDEAQILLNEKSGEAEELKHQITLLTSSTNNLSQKLLDAENVIMRLKLEKEDNLQKLDEIKLLADNFQVQLDAKEEEFKEMKKKYEEKNNYCQQLLTNLHEAQNQLSLYEIQLQQFSIEGHSGLSVQVSELQNENVSLKQKIEELGRKLNAESAEKEESSQIFHIYAQQCNSQLNSLNAQLKSVKLENENLCQKNNMLSKNLIEMENAKEKTFSSQSFENEIADLHSQMSALTEKNNQLVNSLAKMEQECARLEKELNLKESELNNLLGELKELVEENKKLANEAEIPKASEQLLATMESEKVAAAKAVLQNQKLKEQVIELERAFIKLSEEKLEITNQLAHEKHVNTELQNALKNAELKKSDDHHQHRECCHKLEKLESAIGLVNDSDEIEELKSIVRQLQDDKMELTTRINFYESNKRSYDEKSEKMQKTYDFEDEEAQCENTKLLLQQMEEKVKRTMNEIAALDEEKEKLEHLVVQLQGETETIGEYITLYQRQRMLLKQRAHEKDVELLQLSRDKEELKSKLLALDELVQSLIGKKENICVQSESKLSAVNFPRDNTESTAGKIRALINEIGSTTLINNQSIAFEHCSCCSGRLITI